MAFKKGQLSVLHDASAGSRQYVIDDAIMLKLL